MAALEAPLFFLGNDEVQNAIHEHNMNFVRAEAALHSLLTPDSPIKWTLNESTIQIAKKVRIISVWLYKNFAETRDWFVRANLVEALQLNDDEVLADWPPTILPVICNMLSDMTIFVYSKMNNSSVCARVAEGKFVCKLNSRTV